MRVVCVGLATVDVVYRVARIPGADEKVEAQHVDLAAGGPAANAAVTAAALGATVSLVSAVGAHPLAGLITEDLERHGVSLCDALPHDGTPPPISALTVDTSTGQRTVVSRNAAATHAPVPADLATLAAEADVLLLDGHHPALAVAAAQAARAAGTPIVIDAGSWRPVLTQLLPVADVVACSAAFRVGGVGPAETLLADGVPHVAVTDGAHPVRWWSGGRSGEIVVPPVAAVDTAGAGDVFHGALAVAVARDPRLDDFAAALRYASTVAGVRVGHAGPRSWLADPRLAALRLGGHDVGRA
jgi:sugar/nucleoside kinase (ribokinase family)